MSESGPQGHETGGATRKKRRPWWLRWTMRLSVGGLALFLLANLALFFLAQFAAARWARIAADIRGSGELLTYQELEATRRIARPFAGSAMEAVFAALKETQPGNDVLGHDNRCTGHAFEPFSPKCVAATRQYVSQFDGELQQLIAEGLPDTSGIDLQRPIFEHSTHYESFRSLEKLLSARSTLAAMDREDVAAIQFIALQVDQAELLYTDFELMSALLAMAVSSIAANSTETLLASGELSDAELSRLAAIWARADRTSSLAAALRGGRAYWIPGTDAAAILQASEEFLKRQGIDRVRSWTDYFDWDTLFPFATEWWLISSRCVGVTASNRFVAVSGDTMALLQAIANEETSYYRYYPPHNLPRIGLPSLARAVELHGRQVGRIRAASVALAAEQFRQHNGRWPAMAEELVPEFLQTLPLDPFDKMPIRMERKDGWVVFYTVGEDLGDHGGQLPGMQLPDAPPGKRDYGIRLLDVERRGLRVAEPEPETEEETP